MTRFQVASASDVGRVREANEDSLWVGDSVFAVADGMGGHAAGEVASSTALEPVERLDGRVYPDAEQALSALRDAVLEANVTVANMAADDPDLRGMGTTLTAAMREGRRIHLAHVGDSRAYLYRDGEFSQVTTDHTLVQHLIDEGQISEEEAATHPQRSIITRAIGVGLSVDVDTFTLDLLDGDQLLLCSDGLTGVVDDRTIAEVLEHSDDAHAAVAELVRRANDSGGPDNITVVLVRAMSDEEARRRTAVPIRSAAPTGGDEGSWADRLSRFGGSDRAREEERERTGPTRGQRIGAILVAVLLLLGMFGAGGRWLLGRSYFVWVDGEEVVIYRGVPSTVGPVDLYWVAEDTPYTLDEFPEFFQDSLRDAVPATDLADARRIVESSLIDEDEDEESDPDRSGSGS